MTINIMQMKWMHNNYIAQLLIKNAPEITIIYYLTLQEIQHDTDTIIIIIILYKLIVHN